MTVAFEPGSYRDRSSRVLVEGDRILRALGPEALADWEALEATAFFARGGRPLCLGSPFGLLELLPPVCVEPEQRGHPDEWQHQQPPPP